MKAIYLAALASAMCLAACSDNEQFRVNGTIEGNPTMNLRVNYYADGVWRSAITAAREGEFEFFGRATQPAVVEISDYDYRPLARLYAANGQTFTCHIDRSNPYALRAEGNGETERWSAFLRDNADSLRHSRAAANRAVERYVAANRSDVVSTLLLMSAYDASADPAMADSLLSMIDAAARPSVLTDGFNYMLRRLVTDEAARPVLPFKYRTDKGKIATLRPAAEPRTFIALTDVASRTESSVRTALKRLSQLDSLGLIDLSLDPDTLDWKRSIAADSARWNHGWAAVGVASAGIDRLGVPSVPYFIVCDSTGTQLFRSADIAAAERFVNSLNKKK